MKSFIHITFVTMLSLSIMSGLYLQASGAIRTTGEYEPKSKLSQPGTSSPKIDNDKLPLDYYLKPSSSPKPIKIITNSLLIKLKSPLGDAQALRNDKGSALDKTINDLRLDIKSKGGTTVGIYRNFGILHVKIGDAQAPRSIFEPTNDVIKTLSPTSKNIPSEFVASFHFKKSLEANPSVEAVYYDAILSLTVQNIPTGINRIDADRSPSKSGDGRGMTQADIAILDTGVDITHPDLNVVRCISFVNNDLYDSNGNQIPGPPLNNCIDNTGHGTHVAGIAAAIDNDIGVVGTAPGARVHAIKVCSNDCIVSDVVEGLNYVASHYKEIDVVNLSLGGIVPNWLEEWWYGVGTEAKEDAIKKLVKTYGVVVVAGAGNNHIDAKDFTPARVKEAITVSSMTDFNGRCGGDPNKLGDDTFSYFSNYGSVIDLAAPGSNIFSTLPHSKYGFLSGTSMAAPHVTGAVALYLSLHPAASPAEVEEHLKSTGTKSKSQFQATTLFSCDKQGKGYFSTYFDKDNVREPLLYMGWGIPTCPPDCPVAEDVDQIPNSDRDGDGIVDIHDNCVDKANPNQKDTDLDNQGDACDTDDDNDGVPDSDDNCQYVRNFSQYDADDDGMGNVCDPDDDNDGIVDGVDNCPFDYNPDQRDSDHDREGDACDISEPRPHIPPDIY